MVGFTTPQWIMAALIGVQFYAAFALHGETRAPTWNGAVIFGGALSLFAILGWGGFWNRKS